MKVELSHPKTFIGKLDRGFDFVGYSIELDSLMIAENSIKRFAERVAERLCEPGYSIENVFRYVKRWLIYVTSALNINSKRKNKTS